MQAIRHRPLRTLVRIDPDRREMGEAEFVCQTENHQFEMSRTALEVLRDQINEELQKVPTPTRRAASSSAQSRYKAHQ
jgi:hypothetical protein